MKLDDRLENRRVYYAVNRDKIRAQQRAYYIANRSRLLERARVYAERNPERKKQSNRRSVLREHGISSHTYDAMLVAQEGRCAICRRTPKQVYCRGDKLSVDHCHATGHLRGLLCTKCNAALGALDDNVDSLQAAVGYIQRWREIHALGF